MPTPNPTRSLPIMSAGAAINSVIRVPARGKILAM